MKLVHLTVIVTCLSGSSASAGTGEEMNRQRAFFCNQTLIEEQGTVVVPQWVSGTVGVARNTGDCIKISR
jgi:hypothetical protein